MHLFQFHIRESSRVYLYSVIYEHIKNQESNFTIQQAHITEE